MKSTVMLMAALAAMSSNAHAVRSYDSYDAFYSAQPGVVFGAPVKQPAGPLHLYSDLGGQGSYTELRSTLDGRALRIEVAENRITVNGKSYRFARATTFPDEYAIDIYPGNAQVFLAGGTSNRPPLLCMEGYGSGSGEADRHQQIFLLVNPLARKPTFLHLPSLLSSCLAVVATKDGKLAFPKNSYLFDDAQEFRVGLLVSYYTFENQRFVPVPALNQLRLRFAQPEIPFQFSVQDKN
ncbi:hypothetical protein [Paraburkholderia atlantica]|uniref:Uncharacterized protein n=1 Tax=Paraburkholderia atlantica TaxID=2654982 RepID=D5WIV6_PARAM|nr:hypothetical protein [Paraburkholderia atlantica]ADG18401.1 hypothetical protein BC1002_4419 [Paraburkholderia atlantica]MBB5504653.1 hypothetical protein [Paraburkholderia atlantica]